MQFLDPRRALREFGLYGREEVADLGARSGFFSLAALDRLDGGRLFAVDVDSDMLRRLATEAKGRGHTHVHTLVGDAERLGGVPLADESVDKVIAANIVHTLSDRDAFVQEVKRILRKKGKVLVIDWNDEYDLGPRKSHKVCKDDVCVYFTKHGFSVEKHIDAGACHYGMILAKQ